MPEGGLKTALALSLLAAGAAGSFLQPLPSLCAVVPGAALLAASGRRARAWEDREERDALLFLRRLSASGTRPFSRRLLEASAGCSFAGSVRRALDSYNAGAGPSCFGALLKGRGCLPETMVLALAALGSGSNVDRQLSLLLERCSYDHELRIRHVGSMANSMSLVMLGNSVFFPAFAGLCGNIAGMASLQGAWQLSLPFGIVIISYIAITGAVHGFFSGRSWPSRIRGFASTICIGISVFNAVAALGSMII